MVQSGAEGSSVRLEGMLDEQKTMFTLCLLGLILRGCRGLGKRGQESLQRGQSGTSCHRWTTLRVFLKKNSIRS